MKLRIASDLSLPTEAVTQTFAILAMRGVGKTHTASVLAEEFCDARLPFAVLDPTGAWWGLRASADGKGEGYPVTILGGDHADAPLEETAGKVVADMLAEEARPLVLDLSRLSKGAMRRFVADFAERLYEKNRDPLHLIIDEADAFAPQKPRPDEMRMLGAIDEIVRRGRIRGLGCTLISQRSAVLNKDVLTQTEVLIALRTAHPRDRAPILEWMKVHAAPEQLEAVTESLAKLPKGDAWIMSAGWLDLFARVHIRARRTFNSSATPKPGERRIQPAAFAKIDPKILQERLSSAIEKAKAEDPKELRRRIAALEGELRKAKAAPAVVHPGPEEIARIRRAAAEEMLKQLAGNIKEAEGKIFNAIDAILREIPGGVGFVAVNPKTEKNVIPLEKHRAPEGQRDIPSTRTSSFSSTNEGGKQEEGTISSSQQRILDSLAWLESVGVSPSDKVQVALMADQGPTSGGYFNNLGRLRSSGLIDYPAPAAVALTESGRSRARTDSVPTTSEELQTQLYRKISGSQGRILRNLIAAYPNDMAKSDLAEKSGQSPTSGGYFNNLGRLRSLGLIDYPSPGRVVANDVLFLE